MTNIEITAIVSTGSIIVAIIIAVFVIAAILKPTIDEIRLVRSDVDDIKDNISNVVEGSKRMERNVDAINQRTRAHLVSNKKPANKIKFAPKRDKDKDVKNGTQKKNYNRSYSVSDNSF